MTNVTRGIFAGFAATTVLSLLMMVKTTMGVMPELNPIHMLSGMLGVSPALGWLPHFAIGTIAWGAGFALLNDLIPGTSQIVKGIVFSGAAWVLMMVAIMPVAGAGLFGMHLGMMAPVMTLVLHVVFGVVLGSVYALRTAHPVAI